MEVWSFGGGADFVAQQKMLPCATNDAVLRNKGVVGCARRLAGRRKLKGKKCDPLGREVRTFQERSMHLSGEKCVPVVKLLVNCSSKFKR